MMHHPPKPAIALLLIDPIRTDQKIFDQKVQKVIARKYNDSQIPAWVSRAFPYPKHTQPTHQPNTQLASALVKAGWQVDQFIGKIGHRSAPHLATVQHSPDHRKIYLDATDIDRFTREFQKFAIQNGQNYPLIHTWNGLAAQVGLRLKQLGGVQWIHSYWQPHNFWNEDGLATLATDPQAADYASAQVAWEIWHDADEIIALDSDAASSSFRREILLLGRSFGHQSKIEAKRELGFSAFDTVIVWFDTFVQVGDQAMPAIKRWLEIVTQLDQVSTSKKRLPGKQQWVLVPETASPAEAYTATATVIQQQISDLNLSGNIGWSVPRSSAALELYFCAADVCVLANGSEPFADRALRAIAHGCPVITSQLSGARFAVIPEETGIQVAANTSEAWVEAITQVLWDEPWVKRLRQHALGNFDPVLGWTIAAAHLSEVYRRLLAQTISQIPLWHSQKPYSITLPQQTVADNFKRWQETLYDQSNLRVAMPSLSSQTLGGFQTE